MLARLERLALMRWRPWLMMRCLLGVVGWTLRRRAAAHLPDWRPTSCERLAEAGAAWRWHACIRQRRRGRRAAVVLPILRRRERSAAVEGRPIVLRLRRRRRWAA